MTSSNLALGISSAPGAICTGGGSDCPAGTGVARVSLSAVANPGSNATWPSVQVVFLLETTPYDGVYDPTSPGGEPGFDPCGDPAYSGRPLCEESNAVPFFVENAGAIATRIQETNPHSQVAFGLIDFASTRSAPWDDGDGSVYHVDVGSFVPAAQFGSLVSTSFHDGPLGGGWTSPDSDLRDNFLDSPVTTTLYGALEGSGLAWSNTAHHVLVDIGSTAPRDPAYVENYCVSAHVLSLTVNGSACLSSPCEPTFDFGTLTSPNCLGWITSHDGNPADAISAIAHSAPSCATSTGGSCTIDVVNVATTSTDPSSPGWPNRTASIPGDRALVTTNVAHVIAAGCALSLVTGGSWAGPVGSVCPDGRSGSLSYLTSFGTASSPNLANPGLMDALAAIAFGPVNIPVGVRGGSTPLFAFVPSSGIALARPLEASAACLHNGTPLPTCATLPTMATIGGRASLTWNWSSVPSQNELVPGDSWTAAFDVVASGPPSTSTPIDACATRPCELASTGPVDGWFTRAAYLDPVNASVVELSFPLSTLRVDGRASPVPSPGATVPTPPTGVPPTPILPSPVVLPGVQVAGSGPSVTVANLSIQAFAAGVIAAGFTRMAIRQKTIGVRLATLSSAMQGPRPGPSRRGVRTGRSPP
ncbi:MAG: hypothetical protein ACREDK_05260 [Thermoplasmata archaeon]